MMYYKNALNSETSLKQGYNLRLIMLGTGNALVTEYYNTCFLLENMGKYLLVDGGGGNGPVQSTEKIRN